jgi:hypothetical protein
MSRHFSVSEARQALMAARQRDLLERRRLGKATPSELTALVISEGELPRETRKGLERLQKDLEEMEKKEKVFIPSASIDKAYTLRKAKADDPVI